MAMLNNIKLFMEFEPIVKLVCEAFECRNNLYNASNDADRQMAACNLKQITIGKNSTCLNYEPIKNED